MVSTYCLAKLLAFRMNFPHGQSTIPTRENIKYLAAARKPPLALELEKEIAVEICLCCCWCGKWEGKQTVRNGVNMTANENDEIRRVRTSREIREGERRTEGRFL